MAHYEQGWLSQVLDAAGGAEVRAFFGFLRRGADGRTWRLYLTIDLDEYIEIEETQILHSVTFEGSQYPLGGSLIWVRRTAKLKHVGVQTIEAQAGFLRGELVEANLMRTSGNLVSYRPPTGTGAACTSYTSCTPCLTDQLNCGLREPDHRIPDPGPVREGPIRG
jgi:hypothetical protein